MAKLVKSISIEAPVDQVFAYMSEPTNQVEIWPSIIEVSEVKRLPDGGYTHDWVYKMAGVRLKGSTRTLEFVPNRRFVEKTRGGLDSTLTWTFEPEDGGTRLTVETEYKVPIPVLGRMAEALILKMNEQEGELVLANLKARMEG
jgi:uncharacterized protein YndB with AHSA1/START domain